MEEVGRTNKTRGVTLLMKVAYDLLAGMLIIAFSLGMMTSVAFAADGSGSSSTAQIGGEIIGTNYGSYEHINRVRNEFKNKLSYLMDNEDELKANSTQFSDISFDDEYRGNGLVALEPTYKHIILVDMNDWGGGIVLEDGLFLACESSLQHKTVMRSNFSSALGGGEGLFNLCLVGQGVAVLESNVPEEELIAIDLNNDTLKIDGNMAIAWSPSLQFTVERSGKSLIGSAASGEGLVNVYRGSGRVLMAPVS